MKPMAQGSIIVIMVLLFPGAFCYAGARTPEEVVGSFSAHYGTSSMDETADCTTDRFRQERPKSVWIVDTWKTLHRIGYKRMGAEVMERRLKGPRAIIVLCANIETRAGQTRQKEIYYLLKIGRRWLIDELHVADEEVAKEEMKLRL